MINNSQNLQMFFIMLALAFVFFIPLLKKEKTISSTVITESDPINGWMTHFKNVQLGYAAKGEKALANPFDNAEQGIPSNQELVVLCNNIKNLGFAAHINKSFSDSTIPHHLTVEWS